MTLQPITYKYVMDHEGLLRGVELWQGDQHITVSLEAVGSTNTGYKWKEVKEFLDNIILPKLHNSEIKYRVEEKKLEDGNYRVTSIRV